MKNISSHLINAEQSPFFLHLPKIKVMGTPFGNTSSLSCPPFQRHFHLRIPQNGLSILPPFPPGPYSRQHPSSLTFLLSKTHLPDSLKWICHRQMWVWGELTYLPQTVENECSHKNSHLNVHGSPGHKSQKAGTTHTSIN